MKVGILGLGGIGAGAARLVAAAGHETYGFDPRLAAVSALHGVVIPCESETALSESSDLALIAVFDDAQARHVTDQLLAAAAPPQVVAVLSTVTLETIQWIAERCAGRDVEVLDCGVSGGRAFDAGQRLVVMAGGGDAAFAFARPVLEAFASPAAFVGPLGSGMVTKIARNMLHYVGMAADWEAARLVQAAGVNVDAFVEVVTACERWSAGRMGYGTGFADGGRIARLIDRYAQKDLDAAGDLARALDIELQTAEPAQRVFAALVSDELAPEDTPDS